MTPLDAHGLDRQLAVRERIVWAIDALDSDDPGSAGYTLRGLLEDLDQAVLDDDSPDELGGSADRWVE